MDPVTPIIKPANPSAPARGTLADLIAALIAASAAAIALAYSAIFFLGFLENDAHLWGTLSAFLLCFGVGALGYVPAAIIAALAWKAHKRGATRRTLLIALLLLLPWVGLSFLLVFVSDMPKIYSVPIFIIVGLLTAWTLISLRKLTAK